MRLTLPLSLLLLGSAALFGQAPDWKTTSGGTTALANTVKNNLIKSAEKMPEENYAFKPTPEVRSFGQLIGHVADAQYLFCSAVAGEKPAPPGAEKKLTTKAELVTALKDAFAYCDKAYASVTDANAAQPVKFFGIERTKGTVLNFNAMHNWEHYGNVVTYLRLKGIVPPSSEGR